MDDFSSRKEVEIISRLDKIEFIVKGANSINNLDYYYSPKYSNLQGDEGLLILPQIAVSVETTDVIESILERYKSILAIRKNFRDIYILDCNLKTSADVLKLTMKIHETDGVNWCEPNKMLGIKQFTDLMPYQFYIDNADGVDINATPAWKIVSGSPNIKVAVIDSGVDRDHEDLSENVINGYTINNFNSMGNYLNENDIHGTACAGIIGALNNGFGIRGVASGVKILPVNINSGETDAKGNAIICDEQNIADAIIWAVNNGADVLSCSWGSSYPSSYIKYAIDYATKYGRNMKGSVVVCASGNSSSNNVSYPASLSNTIAVGAVDRDGVVCQYSQHGAGLDLVAPSNKIYSVGEIYTTVISGTGNIGPNGDCPWQAAA